MNHTLSIADSMPPLWERGADNIFLASSYSLSRNISPFSFPACMEPSDKKQLFELLKNQLTKIKPNLQLLEGNSLQGDDKQFISEHLLLKNPINQIGPLEAIGFEAKKSLFITINLENHLTIHFLKAGNTLEKGLKEVQRLENQLGKNLDFAFSPRFGFLTASPRECGSALQARALLHLPLSLKDKNLTLNKEAVFSNFHGQVYQSQEDPLTFFTHGLIWIESNPSLGYNQEQALFSLLEASTQLECEEKKKRKAEKKSPSEELINSVTRSYGMLKHSWSLSHTELLEILQSFKLGLDLGLIEGVKPTLLNRMLLQSSHYLDPNNSEKQTRERLRITQTQALLKRLRLNL